MAAEVQPSGEVVLPASTFFPPMAAAAYKEEELPPPQETPARRRVPAALVAPRWIYITMSAVAARGVFLVNHIRNVPKNWRLENI